MFSAKTKQFTKLRSTKMHSQIPLVVDRDSQYNKQNISLYLPFYENKVFIEGTENSKHFRLRWEIPENITHVENGSRIFLGMNKKTNTALFVVGVNSSQPFQRNGTTLCTNREALNKLSYPEEVSAFLWAYSLFKHHTTFIYCPFCAKKLIDKNNGRSKSCQSCSKEYYPRVDPVIITLIVNGDSCLLCRLPTSPKRRYSCVAGFLEGGETVEQCVQREVREEVGINADVKNVKYILSDPWPTEIGSNLMIGCKTVVDQIDFKINENELEDARWFHKEQIRKIYSKESDESFILPEHYTTAYKLLTGWINNRF